MEITVRQAVIEDALAIQKLNADSLHYEYPLESTLTKLRAALENERMRVYVAVYKNEVIGYVHAQDYDVLYAGHCKDVLGLATAKKCQRMGVGTMLMNAVEAWAKETGADCVRLVSGAGRTEAHQFYRTCGYDGGKQQINFKKQLGD